MTKLGSLGKLFGLARCNHKGLCETAVESWRGRCYQGIRSERIRERLEGAILLALKMEEETRG